MLRLTGVQASYGALPALKGIDLEVRAGEVVALIGANGAGKSTTLMTISGALAPQMTISGRIEFDGRRIDGRPPHEIVGLGIAQVPEGRRIFPRLTVEENLEIGAHRVPRTPGISRAAALDQAFGYFPILKERRRQPGGTLSGGEQQMLAMARGLMARPRLLLLDEPSLGLAPLMVAKIFEIIRRIAETGTTVLLVEQNARAALRLAGRAYVMETGRIVMEDRADRMLQDPRVRAAYLGEGGEA